MRNHPFPTFPTLLPTLWMMSICVLPMGLGACSGNADSTGAALPASESIVVESPYVRSTPPGQKVTGAFMVLKNNSAADITFTAASSPMAAMTEIHESSMKNGMMEMHQIDSITIPANGQVELKPGGMHLMLMGVKQALPAGEKVSLNLTFADKSQKSVDASARNTDE